MKIRFYLIAFFLFLLMMPYVAIPLIISILLIDVCIVFFNLTSVKRNIRYLLVRLYRYTFKNDYRTKRLPKP